MLTQGKFKISPHSVSLVFVEIISFLFSIKLVSCPIFIIILFFENNSLFPFYPIAFALTSFFPINSLAFALSTTTLAIVSVVRATACDCEATIAFCCVC